MFEFHISRRARERYQFDQSLFNLQGHVIFANFYAARLFAQKMNQARDILSHPEQAVQAGQINAMGLIDEILHLVIRQYRQERHPDVMQQAHQWVAAHVGENELEQTLLQFTRDFPPLAVFQRRQTAEEYLKGTTQATSHRAIALEEMLMLWVENQNPAFNPYRELFDDSELVEKTAYTRIMQDIRAFFDTQPRQGPEQYNLVDLLLAPSRNAPNSLMGQLDFIRTRWGQWIAPMLLRLVTSQDMVREEEMTRFAGPGPVAIATYLPGIDTAERFTPEAENFSQDREWMPRLVLMAKNAYVWLDQLSKKYQRRLTTLDQIPDEELDQLAQWGMTGLWLIGLWQRSTASAAIKRLCGNPDAIASAYSLAGYWIADDLGGEPAYQNLRDRAWQRGIRLASDMVPNHTGIDSPWVIEHPERFISLDQSPYPSYSFNGPDLSPDPRVAIRIEDHYFDRSDAAVVFQRVDRSSGETRYVYHGNDGTSMPWNDTAQLNYLNPQVREAVIQTILAVARRFPIIRFDAAMTLAKRHLQRLWFPEPGSGGAIPSRAEHSLTREQFEAAIPIEFWREVVDRVALEAPDTLLLAEAFWLMEGYFVRTLGMHRVYNSAFMNLLRDEDNAKYRTVMKNTLEFEPEILKRFVNFMNNPDEQTAQAQFGKGDKYFGIATLLATLPGLPMFGHGQIEGFTEKYGMEYQRAYYDEQADPALIDRHKHEIFPLLHRRALFANVDLFVLYDFSTPGGGINEDVFAFSNGFGSERALVVYHNKYADAAGWVHISVKFPVKGEGDERTVTQRTLADGLGLQGGENTFVLFRDHASGLEYIRSANEIIHDGLYLEMHAYAAHVFLDFRQVEDDPAQTYRRLHRALAGRGVADIQSALHEVLVEPVLAPFRQIANAGYWDFLQAHIAQPSHPLVSESTIEEAKDKAGHLLNGIQSLEAGLGETSTFIEDAAHSLQAVLTLPLVASRLSFPGSRLYPKAVQYVLKGLENQDQRWAVLFTWAFLSKLETLAQPPDAEARVTAWLEEWHTQPAFADALRSYGDQSIPAAHWRQVMRILVLEHHWYSRKGHLSMVGILEAWLGNEEVRRFLQVHQHSEVLWFNREAFEEFLWWMMTMATIEALANLTLSKAEAIEQILGAFEVVRKLLKAGVASQYQVKKLLGLRRKTRSHETARSG